MSRLLAIGDIHGCHSALVQLIELIQPTGDDRVVFLGDYVDRGPHSREVLDYLLDFRQHHPSAIFLRGNHDQLMLDALAEWGHLPGWSRLRDISPRFRQQASGSDGAIWLQNGGMQALDSYGITLQSDLAQIDMTPLPHDHLEFLMATGWWHRQEQYLFVHAAAESETMLEEQDPYTFLWERMPAPGGGREAIQIVGHSPTADGLPLWEAGRIRIDTGACFGRALTCLEVRGGTYWQAFETFTR